MIPILKQGVYRYWKKLENTYDDAVEDSEIIKIAIASFTATIVCFFTAMTGSGSGLILVPLLTFLGLHPVQAIAIHKFEATFWTCTSAIRYLRNRQVHTQDLPWYLLIGGIGAFLGARYIHLISDRTLQLIVGTIIILVATWLLFARRKSEQRDPALWKRMLLIASMLGFGIYEGVFGAGNGYFIAALFFTLIGSNELKTVGMITVQAVVWNLVAVLTHYAFGSLLLHYAIPVAICASIGAWFGAGFAIHRGTKFVRWIIIIGSYVAGVAMLVFG
ncbi:MAG: sulfite exporter TauE/SafE family protein [Candidatus Peregrinibacteria bacterium]|nr:sulfite exporter TauE/SafE family protein [Candidatus Peregrinibacteria bacterium]